MEGNAIWTLVVLSLKSCEMILRTSLPPGGCPYARMTMLYGGTPSSPTILIVAFSHCVGVDPNVNEYAAANVGASADVAAAMTVLLNIGMSGEGVGKG